MKQVLTEMLVCPSCLPDENVLNSEVIQQEEEDIVTGSLACQKCGRIYPIDNGIALLDPRPSQERPLLSIQLRRQAQPRGPGTLCLVA